MDYDEMLSRGLDETEGNVSVEDRFEIPEVDVIKDGNFTLLLNIDYISDQIDRDKEELLTVFQNDLGTSAEVRNRGLRFTGDFGTSKLQQTLDNYVEEFVFCDNCESGDTRLVNDESGRVILCDTCGHQKHYE